MKFMQSVRALSLTVIVAMPTLVAAAPAPIIPTKPDGAFGDLATAISKLFNFGITASAIIFMALLLVGGISYLASAGNEQATAKAKRLLVDAIIGLIIVLSAWAVGNFVLNKLGVNVSVAGTGAGNVATTTGGAAVAADENKTLAVDTWQCCQLDSTAFRLQIIERAQALSPSTNSPGLLYLPKDEGCPDGYKNVPLVTDESVDVDVTFSSNQDFNPDGQANVLMGNVTYTVSVDGAEIETVTTLDGADRWKLPKGGKQIVVTALDPTTGKEFEVHRGPMPQSNGGLVAVVANPRFAAPDPTPTKVPTTSQTAPAPVYTTVPPLEEDIPAPLPTEVPGLPTL